MTRIDFYVLPEGADGDTIRTACRLCEKAVSAGMGVYVHTPQAETAQSIDQALWSFRQGSFVSHERYAADAPPETPLPSVLIGQDEPPASHLGALLNLGDDVPGWFSRFERVLELVSGDAAARAASRERFKFYRDRGYQLETHNL